MHIKFITLIIISILSVHVSGMSNPPENINPAAIELIVEKNNMFTFDLYQKLKNNSGNIFFSPYSISTALAMIYGGAVGETEIQMAKTLHFNLDQKIFHKEFSALQESLNESNKSSSVSFNIANSLWLQNDYNFLKSYLNLIKENYDSEFNCLDFRKTEKARKTVNSWVEKKTKAKIKNLIKEGMIGEMTKLVLTNAIYFKGIWEKAFDKKATRPLPFYLNEKKSKNVAMMYQKGKFRYRQDSKMNLQAIELPYDGERLSMLILLPEEKEGITQLEEKINENVITEISQKFQSTKLKLFLPKFKMINEFSLEKILSSMGMPNPFSNQADFSGMTGVKDLNIDKVIHKAFVDVYEEGTEAAAATAVTMRKMFIPQEIPVFKADHPFIFIIRDDITKSILFMGRVSEPE